MLYRDDKSNKHFQAIMTDPRTPVAVIFYLLSFTSLTREKLKNLAKEITKSPSYPTEFMF